MLLNVGFGEFFSQPFAIERSLVASAAVWQTRDRDTTRATYPSVPGADRNGSERVASAGCYSIDSIISRIASSLRASSSAKSNRNTGASSP